MRMGTQLTKPLILRPISKSSLKKLVLDLSESTTDVGHKVDATTETLAEQQIGRWISRRTHMNKQNGT